MRAIRVFILLLLLLLAFLLAGAVTPQSISSTVPALPLARAENQTTACSLDLSDEFFGGVGDACARGDLDRSRCCPVLSAWLFAAHARFALALPPAADEWEDGPMVPDDGQKCAESLQNALERRNIRLLQPNSSCDTVLCFCGIRLHQIASLHCPAAFHVIAKGDAAIPARNVTPTATVRKLERDCRNASYSGCNRCLHSLGKLKGVNSGDGDDDRAERILERDCQLMGLTWLLARNRTAYIPTVSSVLRALLYSARPPQDGSSYKCSPDQAHMPLAVDSLQFQSLSSSSAAATITRRSTISFFLLLTALLLLLPSRLQHFLSL
ncbi:putative GPI-anchored protein At4g28100 [Curcuma longa]|uniref:putative GPI-anchored protein At4g28100 n=1 Tax=Curcuma longa TaxID=136217 RepID=UPI003D9F8EB6